jgi:hypothetical protein
VSAERKWSTSEKRNYVSQMYPVCILITSADTCIPNVSCMYLASQIRTSLDTFSGCILLECNRACKIQLRYIDTSGYIRDTCILQDTCRIHAGYIDTSRYVSYRKRYPKSYRKPPLTRTGPTLGAQANRRPTVGPHGHTVIRRTSWHANSHLFQE